MAPQLQINQGPQDALLFDNTRSYFTNVGYVRTSNFQLELRDVDPQNSANLGGTVNFVIPKAADLLGPVDLMIEFDQPTAAAPTGAYWGWVESVGLAMIEKVTFSVGSHDVEVLTGEHLNIMNELMKSDNSRHHFSHVLKTGRPLVRAAADNTAMEFTDEDDISSDAYDRIISLPGTLKKGKKLIVPLGLFFTTHPSKYFPLAAIAGSNDVRISVKFRNLKELVQVHGAPTVASSEVTHTAAPTDAQASTLAFTGSAFASKGCFLRCHYIHVTGPEATALMNREHVRLMKLWSGNEVSKQFSVSCSAAGAKQTLDLDLSFLHPVQELVITIRKVSDMGSSTDNTVAPGSAAKIAANTAQIKNYFAYHGGGKDPNLEALHNQYSSGTTNVSKGTHLKTANFVLKLNGQSRHLDGQGIDRDYLMNRLMPMLHSNTSQTYAHLASSSAVAGQTGSHVLGDHKMLEALTDRKEIYVYPFALNPEGANPSGSVNFSKVSHAKLSIGVEGYAPDAGSATTTDDYQVDVYGIYYNWLAVKDGRALLSFA